MRESGRVSWLSSPRYRFPALYWFILFSAAFMQLGASPWEIPAPGSCITSVPSATGETAVPDASGSRFPKPGELIDHDSAGRLKSLLPPQIWGYRDQFFYVGMQLEIGPCYRDYSPPIFFAEATQRNRGVARLDGEGLLENHTFGLPFDPAMIEASDPRAALKWAWNAASAYQGAGQFGDLRLSWVSADGIHAQFIGDYFNVTTAGSDAGQHELKLKKGSQWAGGGATRNRATGKKCAWRQFGAPGRDSDLLFYAPGARRVIRGNSSEIEGALVGCLSGPYSSLLVHGGAPQRYEWEIAGVRDTLAPINISKPAFPTEKNRDFGPAGIS